MYNVGIRKERMFLLEKNTNNENQMSRGLKSRHVQLMALGGTIGTGLFLGAGQSIHLAGPSIIIAYVIAGVACFFLMRALGELLLSNTNSVSFIEFINKYLGERTGFVAGWTYWFCWIAIAMAEVTAAGLYMKFWFPGLPQWVTAAFLILILFLLNSITVSAFGETEFWFALIKVVAIVALIIVGIILVLMHYKTSVGYAQVSNLYSHGFFAHGASGFVLSFQMVLFSFAGIEMIGMTASETQDPQKIIPKCINEVPTRIIIFYFGSLLALMCIFPWQYISANSSPFVQVFSNIGIKSAAAIINFVVLTAAASSCNSAIFTTGRMLFSLTDKSQNKFAKKLGTLSKRHIPANAILFSTIVIAISVVLNILMPEGVFELVSSIATTCFLFVWSLIVITHYEYRRSLTPEQTSKLTFKMPWFPYSDFFVVGFMVFVAFVLIFKMQTLVALIGSIIWLLILYGFKVLSDKHRERKEVDD